MDSPYTAPPPVNKEGCPLLAVCVWSALTQKATGKVCMVCVFVHAVFVHMLSVCVDGQTGRYVCFCQMACGPPACMQRDRVRDRQMDGQTDGQTEGQTEQTEQRTDRQNRHT